MTIRNLQHAFAPKSVAVVGASIRPGSVGSVVFDNILKGGFEGDVWAVNPKYTDLGGRPCYARVADLPRAPDLAVIMTPADTVPGLIEELGAKGTRAALVLSAGLTEPNGLRQKMLDAARPHLLRVIGPNCIGLALPHAGLNAGFFHMAPPPGDIALLSQSGAIAASLLDWAADNAVGFSHIVSLGDMADVDVADCLDLIAGDAATRAIVLYLESIPNPRKFMSAARAAARAKPVIAIKPGRHAKAAKAAATHTGALSGADRVVDAALRRAGILRVDDLSQLFDATETVARYQPLAQARVGIVTNGGGAGVLALDRLEDLGATLADLSDATLSALDGSLPATWSRANPVDIIGDATPERYRRAVAAVAADPGVDVVLVMNCPTGIASSADAALAVASLAREGLVGAKPVLACWMGGATARDGGRLLQASGIPTYDTPAAAAAAVDCLTRWSRAQMMLQRIPAASAQQPTDRDAALAVLRQAASEGRRVLTEPEAKAVAAAYGIPVPETAVASSVDEVGRIAERILRDSPRIALKLVSKSVSHKSDVGGVVLGIETAESAREAARAIERNLRRHMPEAIVDGFAVQPMIERRGAHELIIGIGHDPIFGPVILFGAGGTAVEVVDDTAIGLPPLDDILAGDLIDRTRIGRLLADFRDRKPADRAAIVRALCGLSQLIADFPCIMTADVNPLLADSDGVIGLDARFEIEPDQVERAGPNPVMMIRPYPSQWEGEIMVAGKSYHVRPIRPADAALYPAFLGRMEKEDLRLRFFAPSAHFSDKLLIRLTQLDYDRDMAFVAIDGDGNLCAIARLFTDPDHEAAEYALLVRSDLKGEGLGWAMLGRLLDYARADGLARIEGTVLAENAAMLKMCREFGFRLSHDRDDPGLIQVSLDLAQPA